MIVHDYYVEREIAFLFQGTRHSIADSAFTVIDRYYDRSHHREYGITEFRHVRLTEHRFQISPYTLQMLSTHFFHLDLHFPVLRVHIVKLLLPGLSRISFDFSIKELVDMHDILHPQTQVIQGGPAVIFLHCIYGAAQRRCPEDKHTSKIKIIPESAFLAIYQRMPFADLCPLVISADTVMVGIEHIRPRIIGDSKNPVQGEQAHLKSMVLCI